MGTRGEQVKSKEQLAGITATKKCPPCGTNPALSVRENLTKGNVENMRMESRDAEDNDLRSEYDLQGFLKKGVQGKYARRYRQGTNLVLLTPDVARAFRTENSVNEALRLVIKLRKLPTRRKRTLVAS